MVDWHQETAEDMAKAETILASLSSSISGEMKEEQLRRAWLAYLLVEKSVVFIKVELDEENPGRFIRMKPYAVPDERQAIGFALRHLREAASLFGSGDLARSLKPLRESRNYLRVLLRQNRLRSVRKARSGRA